VTIQQTLTTSFKQDILRGVHDLETDIIKMALYSATADIGEDTVVYTPVGETSGTGYTAGGTMLTGVAVMTSGTTAYVGFTDPSWNPASFTARGALIYNASKGGKAIAVLDFGADKTAAATFTVRMPASTATSALIRIY
jgi:hypothetical protein